MAVGSAHRALFLDLVRAVRVLPRIEFHRCFKAPRAAALLARRLSHVISPRGPQERRSLRKAIGLLDGLLGANCYRRVLLEMALDPAAAEQPVFFGLVAKGGNRSGHAWLGKNPAIEARYDAVFFA